MPTKKINPRENTLPGVFALDEIDILRDLFHHKFRNDLDLLPIDLGILRLNSLEIRSDGGRYQTQHMLSDLLAPIFLNDLLIGITHLKLCQILLIDALPSSQMDYFRGDDMWQQDHTRILQNSPRCNDQLYIVHDVNHINRTRISKVLIEEVEYKVLLEAVDGNGGHSFGQCIVIEPHFTIIERTIDHFDVLHRGSTSNLILQIQCRIIFPQERLELIQVAVQIFHLH